MLNTLPTSRRVNGSEGSGATTPSMSKRYVNISDGNAGVVYVHTPSLPFFILPVPLLTSQSPFTVTLFAFGASRRKVTVLSAFTCGDTVFSPLLLMFCCAMAVELAMASSATIKVFIFMVDVVLVLMAGRVALPFLFITSVECVLCGCAMPLFSCCCSRKRAAGFSWQS